MKIRLAAATVAAIAAPLVLPATHALASTAAPPSHTTLTTSTGGCGDFGCGDFGFRNHFRFGSGCGGGCGDFGFRNIGLRNIGFPNLGFQGLGFPNLGLQGPGFPNLGFPNLGIQGSGFPNFGFPNLGLQGPGFPNFGFRDQFRFGRSGCGCGNRCGGDGFRPEAEHY